jgi:dTDP-4-dehydrorhamnose 3,5-epimerase-like enzyme
MKPLLIKFEKHADKNGSLTAIQPGAKFSFEIRRVYYIYGVPAGGERGFHAHRVLQQVMLVLNGAVTVILDDGETRQSVRLKDPAEGLYVDAGLWREMKDFSPGAVLLVLASLPFDEADYIRDYDEFLLFRKELSKKAEKG